MGDQRKNSDQKVGEVFSDPLVSPSLASRFSQDIVDKSNRNTGVSVAASAVGMGLAAQSASDDGLQSFAFQLDGESVPSTVNRGSNQAASGLKPLNVMADGPEAVSADIDVPSDELSPEVAVEAMKGTSDEEEASVTHAVSDVSLFVGRAGSESAAEVSASVVKPSDRVDEDTVIDNPPSPSDQTVGFPDVDLREDASGEPVADNSDTPADETLAEDGHDADANIGDATLPTDQVPGDGGVVDGLLGDGGLVGGLVGEDGLLDSVTGEDGVVDAILGDGGVVDGLIGDGGVVDGLLGDGGLVDGLVGEDGLLDSVTGEDGVVDAILGDGGVVDGLLGDGGVVDGLLGDGGLVGGLVGEDGLLDSVTGEDGVVDAILGD
ncbi:hypothetical protein O4H61_20120, partial [Roseovarius aestuarii]|nr:hypothetical protein [Roseovarius aestuarii]